MDDRQRTLENLREVAEHAIGAGQQARSPLPPADRSPPARPSANRSRLARWGGLGLVLAALLAKLKYVLAALKILKLSSLVTMLLSIYAYSLFWGWPFAAGFVMLILIHELGHGIVMRAHGIPAGAPTFIPFIGAVIVMKGHPRNAFVEAKVAFGGPILGSLAALACLLAGMATGSGLWRSLAFSGFLINLFNLLPVSPLDGGRIAGAISRKIWALGFAIGIPGLLLTRSPMLLIVLLLGLLQLFGRRQEPAGYFDIATPIRLGLAAGYFGLAILLALGAALSHVPLA